uniref:Uncharacterized protein n=1 Tax=Glossina brevipalpis TaxID=37001 RepID=A0A1A9WLC2_9MUSC
MLYDVGDGDGNGDNNDDDIRWRLNGGNFMVTLVTTMPSKVMPSKTKTSTKTMVSKPTPFKITPSIKMPLKPMPARLTNRPNKKPEESEKLSWTLTVPMPPTRKASKRTNNSAKPIGRDISYLPKPFPTVIPPGVLKHKASKRILELAEPRHLPDPVPVEIKANAFLVSPNALKYKATKRTRELAEAREYVNNHTRDDPYEISPAALKAKPKKRTIELAKPRKNHFLQFIF